MKLFSEITINYCIAGEFKVNGSVNVPFCQPHIKQEVLILWKTHIPGYKGISCVFSLPDKVSCMQIPSQINSHNCGPKVLLWIYSLYSLLCQLFFFCTSRSDCSMLAFCVSLLTNDWFPFLLGYPLCWPIRSQWKMPCLSLEPLPC